jgi:hypothetical protein
MPSKGVFIDLALSRQVFINIENSEQNGITQKVSFFLSLFIKAMQENSTSILLNRKWQ